MVIRNKPAHLSRLQGDDKSESLRYCKKPAQSTYSSTPQSRAFRNALTFTTLLVSGSEHLCARRVLLSSPWDLADFVYNRKPAI
ncbi:MAG: hypothetical protein ABFD18_18805 [Syntrophomonas sp.]